MKKIIIILGCVILLAVSTFFFMLKKNQTPQAEDPQTSTEIEQSSVYNPSVSTFTPEQEALQNQVKEKIQNNAIQTEYSPTPGSVLVDKYPKEVSEAKNPDYDTLFYPETNTFDIMLYTFPLEETRQRAGKYLAERIGVPESSLCQFRIIVGVSPSTSSFLSGKNLGLSGCPGSVDLSSYTENIDGMSNLQELE
jgi:hypothetical protein